MKKGNVKRKDAKKRKVRSKKDIIITTIVIVVILAISLLLFILLNNGKMRQRIEFELANVVIDNDKNNKYGLLDLNGKVIAPYEYDFIDDFYAGTAIATKDGKDNIIDETGKIIKEDIGRAERNGEFYIVEKTFNDETIDVDTEIKPMMESGVLYPQNEIEPELPPEVELPSEPEVEPSPKPEGTETIAKEQDVKWAVLDNKGNIILDYEYSNISMEGDTFIVSKQVGEEIQKGLLNLNGKEVLKIRYDDIFIEVASNYAIVTAKKDDKEEKYLYYAKTGKTISRLDRKYKEADRITFVGFDENSAIMQVTKGEEIKNIYIYEKKLKELKDYVEPELIGDYLIAKKDNKLNLFNKAGKNLTELDEYKVHNSSAAVQKGNQVEIYKDSKKVKTLDNYKLEEMYMDMTVVTNNGNNSYEIYDNDGNLYTENMGEVYQILTPNIFVKKDDMTFQILGKDGNLLTTETVYFYNGILDKEGQIKYITIYTDLEKTKAIILDESGKEILKGDYSQVWATIEGEKYVRVQKNNKWGLYDLSKGELILETTYDAIEFSTKGKYIEIDGSIYNIDGIKIK